MMYRPINNMTYQSYTQTYKQYRTYTINHTHRPIIIIIIIIINEIYIALKMVL